MKNTVKITDGITWVGASDRRLALFENIFPLTDGVAYNAYIVRGEKIALLDTADSSVVHQYLENVESELDGREPDYLIINHMEPDHCSLVADLMARYPKMQAVGTAKVPTLIKQFFGADISDRFTAVTDGDSLDLGGRTLHFVTTPMVHWPEVMVTYDDRSKTLFSADAFGSFGAHHGGIFDVDHFKNPAFEGEARRYYTNIVGKYGPQVLAALKKASALEIEYICPLHGPVWHDKIAWTLEKHAAWASYTPETRGALVVYGSMYGNTASVAARVAREIAEKSGCEVKLMDASGTDKSYLVSEAFRLSHIVFAAPTYNMGLYPPMREFIDDLEALWVRGRTAAVIENGSWSPASGKIMREKIAALKDFTLLEPTLTIRGASVDESAINAFCDAVAASLKA